MMQDDNNKNKLAAATATKDRDQRLQSARKKLKSYRAKQAQAEKAKRQSALSHSISSHGNSGTSSVSISPARLVGTVLNEAVQESQVAMTQSSISSSSSSINSNYLDKRSSQRLSVSFDKRHSRTIPRSGAGHGRGHSRTGSISLTPAALAGGIAAAAMNEMTHTSAHATSRPPSAHFANITRSHTRGHSRSGSRSLAARSRPASLVGEGSSLAHTEEKENSWTDMASSAPMDQDAMKTPTMDTHHFAALDVDSTPIADPRIGGRAPLTLVTEATPTAPSNHNRRASRHVRKVSVSTRRESMEIMGGLTSHDPTSHRNSRRLSSQRWSGLQTASILFGGAPDYIVFDRRKDMEEERSDDEGGDRLTALEKLEGKRRDRDSRQQSSVQLPSFDDVHGEEGMDKRASLSLLEANDKSTSSDKPPATTAPATAVRTSMMAEPTKDLGILLEEEEEEEESVLSTPAKERGNFDMLAMEERLRRKEVEQEVIKRNRRGSLTPRPLKLKSRPASLFVAPRSATLTASPSLPSSISEEHADDSAKTSATMATPTSWSFSTAQEEAQAPSTPTKPTPAIESISRATPPSREKKRSWRSSMPVAPPRPLQQVQEQTIVNNTSTSPSPPRQGMRALRLGSNTGLSSTASSQLRQHQQHTDSTSSVTSSATSSSHTAALSNARRGSLLYNASSIPASLTKDDVPASIKKRGSLLYKISPLDNISSAPAGEPSFSTTSSVNRQPSSVPASAPSASIGGVPLGMFEELKSKHQRDITLLDEARVKIARLESTFVAETEQKIHQYTELERWSAEEKRALGQRIESLEASIAQIVQVREAKERVLLEEKQQVDGELAKLRTEHEDVEAERDMLREDVEGWRTRCSDLERSVRVERSAADELRRNKAESKQRIKELLDTCRQHGIAVERRSIDDEDELSADLVAVLRSPNLAPASPLVGGQREGASSPEGAFQIPPQQAVQLLKEMRQQIFNLAGRLEHERKQHLLARQEAEEAKTAVIKGTKANYDESVEDTTLTTVDSHLSSPAQKASQRENPPSSSTPPRTQMESSSSDGQLYRISSGSKSSKKKRAHAFAYDSSMESTGASFSMGSSSATTHQTSYDGYDDVSGQDSKNDEAFLAQMQADMVGLGVGSLSVLPEEEEAIAEQEDGQINNTPSIAPHSTAAEEKRSLDVYDIEAGRRSSDAESVAPPTPALDRSCHSFGDSTGGVAHSVREAASVGSSISSSVDSQGPQSPSQPKTSTTSSHDTITTAPRHEEVTEPSYDEESSPIVPTAPRPEFIREWSFESATAAVRAKERGSRGRPQVTVKTKNLSKPSRRQISIDDFFGIMGLDESQTLPPLPTPEEALEMPPLFIEDDYAAGRQLGYGVKPRYPSQIRPPVPRTSAIYARSNSDRSSTSSRNSSQYHQQQQTMQSKAAADAAAAGGMLSRVASLTSAFSGLGGYLIGSSPVPGAAGVAAAAAKVCNSAQHDDHDLRSGSISWAVTRREEEMA